MLTDDSNDMAKTILAGRLMFNFNWTLRERALRVAGVLPNPALM